MKSEHLHEESKTKQQGVEGQNISTDAQIYVVDDREDV